MTAYQVVDPNAEGVFVFDPEDKVSADNTGTVLVNKNGDRFKRLFTGDLNAGWFGAVGDGDTDDTAALQLAIDEAERLRFSLYIPGASAFYALTAPLEIRDGCIRIYGDGMRFKWHDYRGGTILRPHKSVTADKPLESMMHFPSQPNFGYVIFLALENITFNGDGRCNYAIYAKQVTHTRFYRLAVVKTKKAALAFGYGWCNDIEDCELHHNEGHGFFATTGAINALNIVNSKIFSNGGIGVDLGESSAMIRITGCTVENNETCGVVVREPITTVTINSNYFEGNGTTGFRFDIPDRVVKANILVSGKRTSIDSSGRVAGPITIDSNYVRMPRQGAKDTATFVACYNAIVGCQVTNTNLSVSPKTAGTYVVLRTGTSETGNGSRVENVTLHRNALDRTVEGVDLLPIEVEDLPGRTDLHTADVDSVQRANYAPTLSGFTERAAGGAGGLTPTDERVRTHPVYSLTGAATTGYWGFSIDLEKLPELAGALVYFALQVRASTADARAQMYSTHSGPQATSSGDGGAWSVHSYVERLPESGTVGFFVRMQADNASSRLDLANPVLAEVGTPFNKAPRADGTAARSDIVLNSPDGTPYRVTVSDAGELTVAGK